VEEGAAALAEKVAWKFWKQAMLNRRLMNMGSGKIKNRVVNGLAKDWTKHRSNLDFPPKSFNQLWREKKRK
jgi:L-lactate dehydrogenase complex protein LldF